MKSCIRVLHKKRSFRATASFVKIVPNFYPYVPYFLADLSEIQYRKLHMPLSSCHLRERWCKKKAYLHKGVNEMVRVFPTFLNGFGKKKKVSRGDDYENVSSGHEFCENCQSEFNILLTGVKEFLPIFSRIFLCNLGEILCDRSAHVAVAHF